MTSSKVPYDEMMFALDIRNLCKQLDKAPQKFMGIYPIPRGGIAAGVALSFTRFIPLTTDPLLLSISMSSDILIVDDIFDTGETLRPYLEKGYTCAVLCTKPSSPKGVEKLFCARTMENDAWVDFFWEKKDD